MVDEDEDGVGEFGTFGELAGSEKLRGRAGVLDPPMLGATFQLGEAGVVSKSGYRFVLHLPGDVDACEERWCAYAWSLIERPYHAAFYVSQDGEIFECPRQNLPEFDLEKGPPVDAISRAGWAWRLVR